VNSQRPLRLTANLLAVLALLLTLLGAPGPSFATELKVERIQLAPCPASDAGNQPRRSMEATCYALRGEVINPTKHTVVDTDGWEASGMCRLADLPLPCASPCRQALQGPSGWDW
jgi:hypothetical protein